MEVPSLWKNLAITILQPVRQRTGFRLQSRRVADRGFHISGLRQFEVGDSFRSVSRKHFARTGEEVIIERHPEQNALILFLLDVSGSMLVGSKRRKLDAALDILLHFGSACLWKGNKIQVLAFANKVELESNIITSLGALELFLDELAALAPESRRTDPAEVVDQAVLLSERVSAPADLVCIVSDYLFPSSRKQFFLDLSLLQEKTDVIGILVRDPVEEEQAGHRVRLKVRDAETGGFAWLEGIRPPAILQVFEEHGFEACTLYTTQESQQWYETLDDFFILRREDYRR